MKKLITVLAGVALVAVLVGFVSVILEITQQRQVYEILIKMSAILFGVLGIIIGILGLMHQGGGR